MENNVCSYTDNYCATEHFVQLHHKLLSLAGESEEAREDLEMLGSIVKACTNYVSAVNEFEMKTAMSHAVDSGEKYRELFKEQDAARHNAHEAAIVKVRLVNRLAKVYQVEPIFTGDESNRYQIGDFCGAIMSWLFFGRSL